MHSKTIAILNQSQIAVTQLTTMSQTRFHGPHSSISSKTVGRQTSFQAHIVKHGFASAFFPVRIFIEYWRVLENCCRFMVSLVSFPISCGIVFHSLF
jgi:hypothetical protein